MFVFRKILRASFSWTPVLRFTLLPYYRRSIHVQRLTGHVYGWSILNDRLIQKIDLLTSTWGGLCNIPKRLNHAVPTCKRIKLMVKVWFSVLIYQTCKAFKEAMKYTLFEVIITRLKFWKLKIFQEF